jgi:hypothetical protein
MGNEPSSLKRLYIVGGFITLIALAALGGLVTRNQDEPIFAGSQLGQCNFSSTTESNPLYLTTTTEPAIFECQIGQVSAVPDELYFNMDYDPEAAAGKIFWQLYASEDGDNWYNWEGNASTTVLSATSTVFSFHPGVTGTTSAQFSVSGWGSQYLRMRIVRDENTTDSTGNFQVDVRAKSLSR